MKALLCAAVLALTATACAGLNNADCNGDWYQAGMRDGRLGAPPHLDAYSTRCGGAQPDAGRYMEGYRAGLDMRPPPNW